MEGSSMGGAEGEKKRTERSSGRHRVACHCVAWLPTPAPNLFVGSPTGLNLLHTAKF